MAITYASYGALVRGGGGVPFSLESVVNIVPIQQIVVVDKNGYIGYDLTNFFQYRGSTYYYNYAILDNSANYSESGLGQVTFYTPANNIIGGREYRTVIIGGKEWLAENLDFKFSGLAIGSSNWSNNNTPCAVYYNNNETDYGIDGTYKCGLLYNGWAVNYLEDNKSELIPGWHVPTKDEFIALINAIGDDPGTKLKAANVVWASSWNGTDVYGFGALPTGSYQGSFSGIESNNVIWSNTLRNINQYAFHYSLSSDSTAFAEGFASRSALGASVRLVKDAV